VIGQQNDWKKKKKKFTVYRGSTLQTQVGVAHTTAAFFLKLCPAQLVFFLTQKTKKHLTIGGIKKQKTT
jgi:hypothetical protein